MQGSPKHLNSASDYEYVRQNYDNWKTYWQALYDERLIWQSVGTIPEGESGIEDDSHKVIESEDEQGRPTKIQMELAEDENARYSRPPISFTKEYIESVLAGE